MLDRAKHFQGRFFGIQNVVDILEKGVKTAVVSHAQGPFVKSCESGALLRSGLRLAFGLALALSGCAHGVPAAHALRIADNADPDSLNPLLLHDQDTIGYALLYCQTLVGLDASNRLTPVLTTRLPTRSNGDISADGRTLTYRLRRNVRFADGSALTSADVAFTYRAIIDSRNNVLSQDVYRRIRNVTTPNPYTVVVRLKRPWNAAPAVLFAQADFAFGILPHRAFATSQVTHSAWNEHPYGTGPFRVVEWRRGDRVVLGRNPYFSPRPRLARIELKMFPNPESGFVALRAREVDVAYVTPDALERARALRGVRILRTPENATIWLTLQTRKRPTDDLHVRRAIALAVDREAIAKTFHHAFPAASSFLPPVLKPYFDPTLRIARPNVRAANAELESAGWRWHGGLRAKGGMPLEGTFVLVASHVVDVRVATVVQQELAQIGMRVAIKSSQRQCLMR